MHLFVWVCVKSSFQPLNLLADHLTTASRHFHGPCNGSHVSLHEVIFKNFFFFGPVAQQYDESQQPLQEQQETIFIHRPESM